MLVRLAYDGTDLRGASALVGMRTVAGEVQAALRRAGEAAATVDVLSRTDGGVHARGQVAVLDQLRGTPDRVLHGLRHQLPPDIAAEAICAVAAPPQVVDKTYVYALDVSASGQPWLARFTWRPPFAVPEAPLAEVAALIPGDRDWAAFARRGERRVDLRRRIVDVRWRARPGLLCCVVRGEAFTYRLVRSLVGAMIAVARGALPREDLVAALAGTPTDASREQAPACGLHLQHIALAPAPAWEGCAPLSDAPWEDLDVA